MRRRTTQRSRDHASFHDRPHFRDISLNVARGEIVGLFGLVGSGRSELLETIFGLHRPDSGRIQVDGDAVSFGSARDAVRAGLALVPEERQRQGLFFNLTLRHNLVLASCAVTRDRAGARATTRSASRPACSRRGESRPRASTSRPTA